MQARVYRGLPRLSSTGRPACYGATVRSLRKMFPLLALAAIVALAFGARQQLSWQAIGQHVANWHGWVTRQPALAGLSYSLGYALVVGLSLPAGGVLSVLGGALFGVFAGSMLAVTGASGGSVLLFLIARSALGEVLARRARPLLARLHGPVQRDGFWPGFWALLALRLIPVVPFWLGNLAPALLGMRLLPFAAATVIGIVPATVVLVGIGAGAADVLARGQAPDLSALTAPGVLWPLLGLGALSVLPVAWQRWRGT